MAGGAIRMGSDRSFGLVFAAVCALAAAWPLLGHHAPRWWALGLAAAFLLAALVRPAALAPLNRAWFALGLALGKVMTPVAMALLFVVAVIPTALVLKLLGKDPLRRRLDSGAASYWEPREQQPGPMREQY